MRPEVWPLEQVAALDRESTVVWATASVQERARKRFGFEEWSLPNAVPGSARNLVAIGGGTLLDEAKAFVHDRAPLLRLIAIPSIWGSGAEAVPIVVLNRGEKKEIRMGEEYLPHARAVWSELAETISPERAIEACGDVWAHAIEGFLSPLASEALRSEIAELIRSMIALPPTNDARWFEVSARAAAAQARSSVGLVHGIAHTLEPVLSDRQWGHAALCATFLLPVLQFDLRVPKTAETFRAHGIDPQEVGRAIAPLFDRERYASALPSLSKQWREVLRDRSTRTNSTLVRQDDLAYFLDYA